MINKKHKNERLLEIDNVHVEACGPPPSIDASDKYVGYFENGLGEQWVFVGYRKAGEAIIRGGDVGWDTEFRVSLACPCPNEMILNEPEKLWIFTCLMAMGNRPFTEVVDNYNEAAQIHVAESLGLFDSDDN